MKLSQFAYTFLFCFLFTISVFPVSIVSELDGVAPIAAPAYRTDTGNQNGRLVRNDQASTCGTNKAAPALFNSTPRLYDEYGFVALESGCVTVTLAGGNSELFSAAYINGGLSVSDPRANYKADIGTSPSTAVPSRSYSFNVTKGQTFSVAVSEVNTGGGLGIEYRLDVEGVKLEPDFSINETFDTNAPQRAYAYENAITGNQAGRINRQGLAGTCENPKNNPGERNNAGTMRRDLYRFVPVTSGCVQVSLRHQGSSQLHIVAYDENGFDPNSTSDNYMSDIGGSASNSDRYMSFLVKAGVPFEIVVHEVNTGSAIGDNYTLNVSGIEIAPTVNISGKLDSINPAETADFDPAIGTQRRRLNRNGIQSRCGVQKENPGPFSSGSRQYDSYTFVPARSGCVEVTLESVEDAKFFSAAYDQNGLDPDSVDSNYLADSGASNSFDGDRNSYSFSVTAGVPFTIVVNETDAGDSLDAHYKLQVRGSALNAIKRSTPFDFDGDGRTDPSVFRPNQGEWWYLRSMDNDNRAFQFGQSTDVMVPADYTGDGVTDIAFFRPSTGFWYVLKSEDESFFAFPLGTASDIPAPGDYDNDGIADPAVFRPSTGTWYILRSSDEQTAIIPFGTNGDKPVVADYDGDGASDIAIYRPSVSEWWIQRSNEGLIAFQFGSSGDIPTPADFTGDGRADVAFFRPSNEWFVLQSEDEQFYSFPFGTGGDIPVPGDYDGDGVADPGVFRGANNTWYALQANDNVIFASFGTTGDIPTPTAYQP